MIKRFKKLVFASLLAFSAFIWSLESTHAASSITQQGNTAATQATSGITEFFSTIWEKAPLWIAAMIVFACSFVVAKIIKEKVVDKVSGKLSEDDQDVLVLIGRATYVAVLSVGITIALKIGGIDLTTIIAAIGFGIGFALQDLIMNFIAGIMILINRQFTLGDFIQVNTTIGQVVEIQSRATVLKALDGTRVIVPNSQLFTNQVTSFTSNPFRRIDVGVGVEYRTDLAHASQIIKEALAEQSGVLQEPACAILLDSFGDSSINFIVRFWVDSRSNWLKTKSQVIQGIKKHFDEAGIGIPFPIHTLVFDRETEGVMMPIYQASHDEFSSQQNKREKQEVDLAAKIAASTERAKMVTDIVNPMVTPLIGVGMENVAATASAVANVQAVQDAQDATPPLMPEMEKTETGASFLTATAKPVTLPTPAATIPPVTIVAPSTPTVTTVAPAPAVAVVAPVAAVAPVANTARIAYEPGKGKPRIV